MEKVLPSYPGFAERRGFRVVSSVDGWLLSEHLDDFEAAARCDLALKKEPRGKFVMTNEAGDVLYAPGDVQ